MKSKKYFFVSLIITLLILLPIMFLIVNKYNDKESKIPTNLIVYTTWHSKIAFVDVSLQVPGYKGNNIQEMLQVPQGLEFCQSIPRTGNNSQWVVRYKTTLEKGHRFTIKVLDSKVYNGNQITFTI